jgi:hypothetical protein
LLHLDHYIFDLFKRGFGELVVKLAIDRPQESSIGMFLIHVGPLEEYIESLRVL